MTLERNPEAEWEVTYMLKPWYRFEKWKGQAPSESAANLFCRTALLAEGYRPENVMHVETKRVQ